MAETAVDERALARAFLRGEASPKPPATADSTRPTGPETTTAPTDDRAFARAYLRGEVQPPADRRSDTPRSAQPKRTAAPTDERALARSYLSGEAGTTAGPSAAATPTETGEITGPIAGTVKRVREGTRTVKEALTPSPSSQRGVLGRAWDVARGAGEIASAPFYPVNYLGQQAGEFLTRHSGEMSDKALDTKIARAREIKARTGSAAGTSAEVNELPMLERLRALPYEQRVKLSREAMGAGIEGGAQLATGAAGAVNPGWLLRAPGNVVRAARGMRATDEVAPEALRALRLRPELTVEPPTGSVRTGGAFTVEPVVPKPRPTDVQQTLDEAVRILTGGGSQRAGGQRTLEAAQDLATGRKLDLGTVGRARASTRGETAPASELTPAQEYRVRYHEQELQAAERAVDEGGHAARGTIYDPADAAPGWPRAETWLRKTIKNTREGLPANMALLKERPDSPVITIVRHHHANRAERAIDLIERQPWMKSLLQSGESVEDFGPKLVEWEATGFRGAPPEIQQAVAYLKTQYEQERAARFYLGEKDLREVASYWPRIREKDLDAVVVAKPGRGGLVDDVRTTLGQFEKSREYPTMKIGMAKGETYIDPRQALLIRANTGHNLIETAGMLQDMERAGVVSRGTNAFGKDGVELFKMPTGGAWWARGAQEARAIRDELTSVQHSSLANTSYWLNTYVRNPSLFNPAVHEFKNMGYKFFLSGGNPRKLVQYETGYRLGRNPAMIADFHRVMPESRVATSAKEVFGHAEFGLEHPTLAKVGTVLRWPQEQSHRYLFGTADPAIKYARWRQYLDKGMNAQTAANHVRIDLIDYGTRSQLVDFWRSVPGNFFVTWRTGTVQSLIKQARYHPVRTALVIGGVDYLREMAYRHTGYYVHLPIDYVLQPISRVVADVATKGPLQAGADIGSILATLRLLGPGGNPHALQNMLQVVTNPADLKSAKKVFWGLAQILDATDSLPDIMNAIDTGDTGKVAGYLQAFMAVASLGVHKVGKGKSPAPSWAQLIPETAPGMEKSAAVRANEIRGTGQRALEALGAGSTLGTLSSRALGSL